MSACLASDRPPGGGRGGSALSPPFSWEGTLTDTHSATATAPAVSRPTSSGGPAPPPPASTPAAEAMDGRALLVAAHELLAGLGTCARE